MVAGLLLPDVLTLDTTSADGLVPGLNGRRPADDVIDFGLFVFTGGLGTDNEPAGSAVLDSDCADANDVPFLDVFPYLASLRGADDADHGADDAAAGGAGAGSRCAACRRWHLVQPPVVVAAHVEVRPVPEQAAPDRLLVGIGSRGPCDGAGDQLAKRGCPPCLRSVPVGEITPPARACARARRRPDGFRSGSRRPRAPRTGPGRSPATGTVHRRLGSPRCAA